MAHQQQIQQQRYELVGRRRGSQQQRNSLASSAPPLVVVKAEFVPRHRHSASLQEFNTFPRVQLDEMKCGLGITSSDHSSGSSLNKLRRVPSAPLLANGAVSTNSRSRRSMPANIWQPDTASSWVCHIQTGPSTGTLTGVFLSILSRLCVGAPLCCGLARSPHPSVWLRWPCFLLSHKHFSQCRCCSPVAHLFRYHKSCRPISPLVS